MKLLQDKLDLMSLEKARLAEDLSASRAQLRDTESRLVKSVNQCELLAAQTKSMETKLQIEAQSTKDAVSTSQATHDRLQEA